MRRAVCAFIPDGNGRIVAVHRRGDTSDWGLPGGKVDEGETPEQAVSREVLEETGLIFEDPKPIYTRPCMGDVDYETTTFVGKASGQLLDPSESLRRGEPGVAWVKPRVLLAGSFGIYNLALFEHLLTQKR